MTLFDHLTNLTYTKKFWGKLTEDEKKTADQYMINRFLSMNYPYLELVNEVQQLNLPIEQTYNLYVSIIPKQKMFLKYIGKKTKKGKDEPVDIICELLEIGKEEAKDYIKLLSKEQLKEITTQVKGTKNETSRPIKASTGNKRKGGRSSKIKGT